MRTSLPPLVLATVLLCATVAYPQHPVQYMKGGVATICYLDKTSVNTFVDAPEAYRKTKGQARTKSSNIQVRYEGFTQEAQASFEAAVNIWEALLVTDVTINILARWAPLGQGILGSAGPDSYVMNFNGAQRTNVWYPVALAEKMAKKDLNAPGSPDIVATFNSSNSNWHYGLEGSNPAPGNYDLMSVVLHEIGHGLGLNHAYSVSGTNGVISSFYSGRPVVFETNLESVDNKILVESFVAPSAQLGSQLVSSLLFYNSPFVKAVNDNLRASIYAPSDYSQGSSLAHLDESTYAAGTPNALMTPFISAAERALAPGPIVMAILKEMGWVTTFIEHKKLLSTENTSVPYDVVCKVTSDTGFDASTLSLNYSADGVTYTILPMMPTGTATEFTASIPTGQPKYHYFISVRDTDQRIITNPGKNYVQGSAITQGIFTFEVGPDSKPPRISHVPVSYMSEHDTLRLQAVVSDNLGLDEVRMEWKFNGASQPEQTLVLKPGTDSTYVLGIVFPAGALANGDKIHYRIRAKDKSAAGNTSHAPSAGGFYEVNISGLMPAQGSYFNNFNSLTDEDFFGNGFSISKPAGFENGAIHSTHPYPVGGSSGAYLDLIYQLKVPIKLKDKDAFIRFDEIVLVEPGEPGSVFGSGEFYDYVVVEGSTDGGITWTPVADGYDSRDKNEWLTHYNSNVAGQISNATGHPGLYRSRSINLLDKFEPNDVVAIRFRLFSDPFAAGWGWAIDNLTIQVDTQPPSILHQHTDYLMAGATQLEVKSKVTDGTGLDRVLTEHKLNNGPIVTTEAIVDPTKNEYSITLPFAALAAGDVLSYRIKATDAAGNSSVYPPNDFIKIAALSFASPVDGFAEDFTTTTNSIAGNFFTTAIQEGFTSGAIHSPHPYKTASNYSWHITKPIRVSATNPYIVFDEVVVTEYNSTGPVDYVVMEATKDGVVWEKLLAEHAANFNAAWKFAFDTGGNGNPIMYVRRFFQITDTGKFKAGDVVLIRFRLFSNESTTGWGFAIDNLSIQSPFTGVEDHEGRFAVYPNPVAGDELYIRLQTSASEAAISLISPQGQALSSRLHSTRDGLLETSIYVGDLAAGLYLLRVETPEGVVVRKFVRGR